MLEIAILLSCAAIFVILAVRYRRTAGFVAAGPANQKQEEKTLEEAKKILDDRRDRTEDENILEMLNPETKTDELDRYDSEVAETLKDARQKIIDGKFFSAEQLLIEAICKDNKCAWAYEKLGEIYLAIGKNFTDAEESFKMAVKLDKNSAPSWFGLGEIALAGSKFNQAIDCYQKAVNLSRTVPEYQAALGKAFMEIRQYGKASKALKRASSLDISNQEYKELSSIAEDKHREHSRASKLS